MMWDWNSWTWGMGLMMLFMVVFWSLIIALVIWLIVRATRHGTDGGGPERRTSLDIARERYAKGEITKEQYEQLKKDLS
jgi:putative membrane protein